MVLDVRDLDLKTRFLIKCIRVVNVYDQVISREYTYLGIYMRRRRAIEDVSWNRIITERIVFIGDFNVYSSKWNHIYERLIGVRLLEKLLDKYNLIVINEERVIIRRLLEKVSIIDLIIILSSLSDFMTWYILGKIYSSMLDYKLIVVGWPYLVEDLVILDKGRATGQNIQDLIENANKFEKAILEWESVSNSKFYLTIEYLKEDFEQKVT